MYLEPWVISRDEIQFNMFILLTSFYLQKFYNYT